MHRIPILLVLLLYMFRAAFMPISSETCSIACQNCAVYSVFSSGMRSHSKIAQFNWEYIEPLIYCPVRTLVGLKAIKTRDFSIIFLFKVKDIIFKSRKDFPVSSHVIVSIHIYALNIGLFKSSVVEIPLLMFLTINTYISVSPTDKNAASVVKV